MVHCALWRFWLYVNSLQPLCNATYLSSKFPFPDLWTLCSSIKYSILARLTYERNRQISVCSVQFMGWCEVETVFENGWYGDPVLCEQSFSHTGPFTVLGLATPGYVQLSASPRLLLVPGVSPAAILTVKPFPK